ncbi:TetR/AcrR family transcriptional regulator [Phenylobacterium terrae]|uniref:TetR/AcrR family transcriptional regulator n=1 Tax=Phenylobacterium terrae TaxID=2665495 RepID=A0ABW4N710_9CAUL
MAPRPVSSRLGLTAAARYKRLRIIDGGGVNGNTSETAGKAERKARGPNAVRSAATRAKILDAAVACILECGYYGTTTLLVQERAGVSRGSLLHQFPTKADLMAGVLRHIAVDRHYAYRGRLAQARDDRHRWELLVDVLWDQVSKPEGFVRLEIMVAAYSDPELLKRIAPENKTTDRLYREAIWGLAQRLGVTDRAALDRIVTVYVAALRGLAIDVLYPRPWVDVEGALQLIKENHMAALDRLIARTGAPAGE